MPSNNETTYNDPSGPNSKSLIIPKFFPNNISSIDSTRLFFGSLTMFKTLSCRWDSLNNSQCIISDWSGISLEYAFTFERPVIFIDVPKKVLNPNSSDIVLEPIEISIRNKIGNIVSPNNLEEILVLIRGLDKNTQNISERIREIRAKTVYNIGESAKIGAGYIRQLYNESKNSKNSWA